MAVPANICVAWPSTVASIPSGWTRETALDARYILGAATGADTDLSTDRGATTHVHTSPSHTPTQNAHTHTTESPGNDVVGTILAGALGQIGPSPLHGHGPADSNPTTAVNNGITITVDAATNDLAYTEVIWITSTGAPTTLPSGCYAFFESDTLPSGWSRVTGDRYLKGAAAASNPAAPGGSNTHTHTSPAHTHTQVSHQHTATSDTPDSTQSLRGTTGTPIASTAHTHALTLVSNTATNQPVTTTINSGNGEPPFKKLNVVSASAPDLPTNIIALWLGTNGAIPTGWSRYTAMDGKWLKGANANGESGVTTGGSSQHNHTASDCQPTQDAHAHSISDPGPTGTAIATTSAAGSWPTPAHTHSGWTSSSEVATNNAIGVTIDLCTADAALPKHRTVIYVQFSSVTPPVGPSIGGYTSYNWQWAFEQIEGGVTPETAARIARGDKRFFDGDPR